MDFAGFITSLVSVFTSFSDFIPLQFKGIFNIFLIVLGVYLVVLIVKKLNPLT